MNLELLYLEDCRNWKVAAVRLARVAAVHGVEVRHRLVAPGDDAAALGFRGSPTILVDGTDPFATAGAPFALACRVFETPDGLVGSPTGEQLRAVVANAANPRRPAGRNGVSEGRIGGGEEHRPG